MSANVCECICVLCVCWGGWGWGGGGPIVAMDTRVCGKQSRHDRAEFTDSRWLGWGHSSTQRGVTMAPPLVLMGDTCNRIRPRTPGGRRAVGDHMGRWYTVTTHPQNCPVSLLRRAQNLALCCHLRWRQRDGDGCGKFGGEHPNRNSPARLKSAIAASKWNQLLIRPAQHRPSCQ